MSKLKTPREKKQASLAHDRRSARGQSDKLSRKRVPKVKTTLEREVRHAVKKALHVSPGPVPEEQALALDEAAGKKRREQFKKSPDIPLGEYLSLQKGKRQAAHGRTKAKKAVRAKAKKG